MNLRIPGPIPVHPRVMAAMNQPMINHRGPRFSALFGEVADGLRWAFETSQEVLVLTSSGTGGLEAAVANIVSPGDRVLSLSIGNFGERLRTLARLYGAQVTALDALAGQPIDVSQLRQALQENPPFHALLVTHNETSTGVTNPMREIALVLNELGEARPLTIVDGVSGVGCLPLPMDELSLDVVVSGSQKAWGLPPGLAFVAVSERAWPVIEQCRSPRFYFDLRQARKSAASRQTPWTPAVGLIFGLHEALVMMREEGLPVIHARQRRVGEFTRQGARGLGLQLFANPAFASNAVTAIRVPPGVEAAKLRARLRDEFGQEVAGGQGALKNDIFRIGHMGQVTEADIQPVFDALRQILQLV